MTEMSEIEWNFSVDCSSNEEGSMFIVYLSRKAILLFSLQATAIRISLTLRMSAQVCDMEVKSLSWSSRRPSGLISCRYIVFRTEFELQSSARDTK